MNRETLIWFLSAFFFVPLLYADSQYECGAHGRFEYCIDGIAGCVIGCHCHPGYYFDTDTKICEPNIKLTQDFRRQYYFEPTRVNIATTKASFEEQSTTSNAVDEKIDEIAKDADDLGDWLYNQFFKTIENQVINKTQGEKPPTRKSGDILLKKPAKRSHKYLTSRKKKKKRKSKSLKNKLLQITEDDSIFESDSGYTSSGDETSSSSESASSAEITKHGKKKNYDDHGHKKIIIFNKKPRPPLPSFIFMPNMDSPYYPPIALPPPQAMPMYPMVPVPPMVAGPPIGGPLFSYPGVPPRCEEDNVASSTSSASTTSTASVVEADAVKTVEAETIKAVEASSTTKSTDTSQPAPEPPKLRQRPKTKKKSITKAKTKQDLPMLQGNRNKLFKKLRAKISRQHKLANYFGEQYQGPDAPMNENDASESLLKHNFLSNVNQMPSPPPNVDFKYLAELIHKADLNKNLANLSKLSQVNQNTYENIPVEVLSSRRNYDETNNINNRPINVVMRQKSRMEDPNDSFYTNLGKQIASMIRKIDSKGEREINIEIEGNNPKSQNPVFNEYNTGSRSYWERSVRSPVKNFAKKQYDHLKKSNEDLFSLENKVEIVASTAPTLSLHDLENIINNVRNVQSNPKRNKIKLEKNYNFNASFKLNLLPGNIQTMQPTLKPTPIQNFENLDFDIIQERNSRRKQSNANSFSPSNFRQLFSNYDDPIANTVVSIAGTDSVQSVKPTRMPGGDNKPHANSPPHHLNTNMMPTFNNETANKTHLKIKYQLSPVLINHRRLNYNSHNKYPNIFENAMPKQHSSLKNNRLPYIDQPSYFHHELHHFDYFDK